MVKFATKILQIERKTKKKIIFLCFSEMPPIFEKVSKISNYNETNKYFFIFLFTRSNSNPAISDSPFRRDPCRLRLGRPRTGHVEDRSC